MSVRREQNYPGAVAGRELDLAEVLHDVAAHKPGDEGASLQVIQDFGSCEARRSHGQQVLSSCKLLS
jgi:hypothetical protein